MPTSPNVFTRLNRWATRQDENFLTESLAVVLEQLLVLAPDVGTRLVKRLTGGFIVVPAADASSIGMFNSGLAEEAAVQITSMNCHQPQIV